MIHILVVAPDGPVGDLAGRRSSVELLHARNADEAVDKLARNRRVDAVLLLAGAENAEVARAIREDNLSPPLLFAPASADEIPGVRPLPEADPKRMLDMVDRELRGA